MLSAEVIQGTGKAVAAKALGLSRNGLAYYKRPVPSPIDPPPGSAFDRRMNHPRYPETIGADLSLREISPNHWVAADPCCVSDEDWQKLRLQP